MFPKTELVFWLQDGSHNRQCVRSEYVFSGNMLAPKGDSEQGLIFWRR